MLRRASLAIRSAPLVIGFAPLVVGLIILGVAARAGAASPGLQAGDFVAVVGDSITEQKQYSVFIEDYLLMCQPAADLRTAQFGWGGETAPGFLGPHGQ